MDELLKSLFQITYKCNLSEEDEDALNKVVNVLEKQQKEIKELGEENTSLKAQNDKLNEFLLLLDKQWQEKYDELLEEHTEFYNYLDSNGMEE